MKLIKMKINTDRGGNHVFWIGFISGLATTIIFCFTSTEMRSSAKIRKINKKIKENNITVKDVQIEGYFNQVNVVSTTGDCLNNFKDLSPEFVISGNQIKFTKDNVTFMRDKITYIEEEKYARGKLNIGDETIELQKIVFDKQGNIKDAFSYSVRYDNGKIVFYFGENYFGENSVTAYNVARY